MVQDIQSFRIRCHHAVLDAVVDHLDKVTGAAWTAVQIAVFGGAPYFLTTGCARRRIDTWSKGGKNGVDALHYIIVSAYHQAVATFRSPDAATCPRIHIVDALRFQFGSAADVIMVVGVATIDDHIILFEERDERLQRLIGHAGRHHHPDLSLIHI